MLQLHRSLKRDLPSSLVVFLVAVPLCLGVALASGAPPLSGLLAGIIGGVVVGALSGSQLGVSGPAAGLAAIVLTSVAALGSFGLFLLAVLLAGILQLLLGLSRGGGIANLFPSAVIKGMLAGIGVFIALAQLPHAFGLVKAPGAVPAHASVFTDLSTMLAAPHPGTLLIAGSALAVLWLWEMPCIRRVKWLSLMPAPLLAVLLGVGLAAAGAWWPALALAPAHFVVLPDLSDTGLHALFTGPDWGGITSVQVWTVALTLALVASLETLLSVEAADRLDPQRRATPKNRELMAQGAGNILAGLIGALPVTQVIVRSSANIQSGARTKLSAMLHGLWIMAALLLFPALFGMIPLAALAAILVQVGFKLARPALFSAMWKGGWTLFIPFIVTVFGVVFLDLLKGVGLGLALGLFIVLRNNYRMAFHLLDRQVRPGEPVRIALAQEASFLNKASIQRAMAELPPGSHCIIDLGSTVELDPDIREIIQHEAERARDKGATIEVVGMQAHRRTRVAARLSERHVHATYRSVRASNLQTGS